MAISLEELAAAALDGSVGPVTLAVGAGAVAVALAAGSTRPLRRMATTSVLAVERAGRLRPMGWLGAARQSWRDLVEEARAEYESSRHLDLRRAASPIVTATAAGVVPESGTVIVVPEALDRTGSAPSEATARTRDERGRFIRRAKNGAQPE